MSKSNARGVTLIMCLFFLIVLAILAIAMFRSFGLQERIAGNTREKEHAFAAAQSALQFAEEWLRQQTTAGQGTVCGAGSNSGDPVICSNALCPQTTPPTPCQTETTLPWPYFNVYSSSPVTVSASGGVNGNGDINYQGKPGYYINYLGPASDGSGVVYQVTAYGFGGNSTTAAVVQSAYELQMQSGSDIKPLNGP